MALININTPDLGGAADVTVIEILVKPGDRIEADTPIVTLESDKATMDVPTPSSGIVKELKVKVGDKTQSGGLLLILEGEKDTTQTSDNISKEKDQSQEPLHQKESSQKESHEIKESISAEEGHEPQSGIKESHVLTGTIQSSADIHAGPGVRRIARELGVDLALVAGSGPKQRILKEDVQAFVKNQLSQVQTNTSSLPSLPTIDFSKFGPIVQEPLSRIQKISGKNLQRNWMMIPHVTQFGEADITELEEFRQARKNEFEKQHIKLTPLVFVMKAVVSSLKAFPFFNASLDPSNETLTLKKYFNIGVAVDTPDGLVVPVIRQVDQKGLAQLAQELAHVSEKARQKQLTPGDMQGGSFSISSLGGIGGTAFTPIINYPEVAILGVSKASYKPVYQEEKFVPRLMLPLSLSYDHRVIDGANGARFLNHLTSVLSDIRTLLF